MSASGCDPRWGGEHLGERLRASKRGLAMTRDQYAYPNRHPKDLLPIPELWDWKARE